MRIAKIAMIAITAKIGNPDGSGLNGMLGRAESEMVLLLLTYYKAPRNRAFSHKFFIDPKSFSASLCGLCGEV